jgi:hypothetical protein
MIRNIQNFRKFKLVSQSAFQQFSTLSSTTPLTPESIETFVSKEWPAAVRNVRCLEISHNHALVSKQVQPDSIRPGGYVAGKQTHSQTSLIAMAILNLIVIERTDIVLYCRHCTLVPEFWRNESAARNGADLRHDNSVSPTGENQSIGGESDVAIVGSSQNARQCCDL